MDTAHSLEAVYGWHDTVTSHQEGRGFDSCARGLCWWSVPVCFAYIYFRLAFSCLSNIDYILASCLISASILSLSYLFVSILHFT